MRDCACIAATTVVSSRPRRGARTSRGNVGISVAIPLTMLKLVGSYVIAKMLGFGILGALVIYALLSMLT